MARTLMARLPRLFQTRSWVPWNRSHSCRFVIIKDDFLFYVGNGILSVLTRIASLGDSNENTQYTFMLKKIEKISLLCLLT